MNQQQKQFLSSKVMMTFALVTIFSVLISFSTSTTFVEADWRSGYDQQKQELNFQMDEINSELENTKKKMNDVTALKGSLKEQVASTEAEIVKINGLVENIELSISKLKAQIDYKQQELSELEEQMRSLLKEIQKQQRVSPVELILTSKSLGEAVGKIYNLSSLQVKADSLKTDVEVAKKELEENKLNLEKSKKDLEDSKILVESKKSNLEQLLAQTEGEESKYQSWLSALKDQQNQLSSREAEVNRQIAEEEARRKAAATNPISGGGVPNPYAPGNCWFEEGGTISASLIKPADGVITGNFGCPASYYLPGWPHDGSDIANSIGTPIKATAAGIIQEKGWHGGGFGHFVLVRHDLNGQRFYSIYAHLSSASGRSVGEYVNQGDVIGSMGNTGFSTGSHLHFGLLSDSYDYTKNVGCAWGGSTHSRCYDPARFISSLRI